MECKRTPVSHLYTLLYMNSDDTMSKDWREKPKQQQKQLKWKKNVESVSSFFYYYLFKPLPFPHLMRPMFFYLVCVCGFKSNVREKHLPFEYDRLCWHTRNDVWCDFLNHHKRNPSNLNMATTPSFLSSFFGFFTFICRKLWASQKFIDARNVFFFCANFKLKPWNCMLLS